MPVFERNGFIVHLDRYVWELVCGFMGKMREVTGRLLPVSVNVSRLNLYNLDLLDFLMGLVKKYHISPEYLHLEITESAYTEEPRQLVEEVDLFRKNGFKVSMDDFGRGFSSLNMIKDLPVDTLKLDLGFVTRGDADGRGVRIMGGMVDMAKDMEMSVVVEGVENQEQLDFVRQMGAGYVQGYCFAKPMPKVEFMELFRKNQD